MRHLSMRKNTAPGLLITFCGLDGSGKTTMLRRLERNLRKSSESQLLLTKQPTDFVRSSDIFRTYMDSPDHSAYDYRSLSLLAASDRLQHSSKVIEPALQQGQTVLSDRYFYSCLANLRARGFTRDYWIYEIATSIVCPDIAFFFDIPVWLAIARVRQRPAEKERFIDVDLQHRLREEYIEICESNGGVLIESYREPEVTYNKVWEKVKEVLEKRK